MTVFRLSPATFEGLSSADWLTVPGLTPGEIEVTGFADVPAVVPAKPGVAELDESMWEHCKPGAPWSLRTDDGKYEMSGVVVRRRRNRQRGIVKVWLEAA